MQVPGDAERVVPVPTLDQPLAKSGQLPTAACPRACSHLTKDARWMTDTIALASSVRPRAQGRVESILGPVSSPH